MESSETPIALLTWREFDSRFDGEFIISETPLLIAEKSNTGLGTGLVIWDGSILLAKYLEYSNISMNQVVLELGCGTGLVGIACGLMGAKRTYLTDLGYTLHNVEENIATNKLQSTVSSFELDWTNPVIPEDMEDLQLVVAADVVWVEELVVPLVKTMAMISKRYPNVQILLSHQTRSVRTDELLFEQLASHGFVWEIVPKFELHPQFQSARIRVFRISYEIGKQEL